MPVRLKPLIITRIKVRFFDYEFHNLEMKTLDVIFKLEYPEMCHQDYTIHLF